MSPEDVALCQQAIELANSGQKQAAYEQFCAICSHGNTEDVTLLYWIAVTTPSPEEALRAIDTIARIEPSHPRLQELQAYVDRKRQRQDQKQHQQQQQQVQKQQQPPPQYRPPQQTPYGQPPYGEPPRSQQQPTQPPPTQYYPQYPNYQSQQQNRPMMPLPSPQFQTPVPGAGQPKKKHGPWFWILIAFGILIVFSMCMSISQVANQSGSASNTSASATDTPTDTPVPTLSPAQVEKVYKASTSSITVENLDKEGNNDKGKNVHVTCKILKFVKDDSGNTAGANVEAPDSYSTSIIQILFPSGTDVTKLNEGDIVEVWGSDEGVFSGQNAFGGTVQEVAISAQYMTDETTNYQTS